MGRYQAVQGQQSVQAEFKDSQKLLYRSTKAEARHKNVSVLTRRGRVNAAVGYTCI